MTTPSVVAVTRRTREALLLVGGGLAVSSATAVVATVDPNQPGHYPTCPFLAVTGYWCPGCGALRACHALAHGDVLTALARNPLTVVAAGWLAVWYLSAWVRLVTGRPRRTMVPPGALWALLVVVLAYWVARNVPGWTWLSPA